MHLRNFPRYFKKGNETRKAYYTVEARELVADGWQEIIESSPDREKVEIVIPQEGVLEINNTEDTGSPEDNDSIDFHDMTKNELMKFATENGLSFKPTMNKSSLVDICDEYVRARDSAGRFVADDPSTPEVNEAWVKSNE